VSSEYNWERKTGKVISVTMNGILLFEPHRRATKCNRLHGATYSCASLVVKKKSSRWRRAKPLLQALAKRSVGWHPYGHDQGLPASA